MKKKYLKLREAGYIPAEDYTDYTVEYTRYGCDTPLMSVPHCYYPSKIAPPEYRSDIDTLACKLHVCKSFSKALFDAAMCNMERGKTVIKLTETGEVVAKCRYDSFGNMKINWL